MPDRETHLLLARRAAEESNALARVSVRNELQARQAERAGDPKKAAELRDRNRELRPLREEAKRREAWHYREADQA